MINKKDPDRKNEMGDGCKVKSVGPYSPNKVKRQCNSEKPENGPHFCPLRFFEKYF
jgi:hypothetical protein